MTDGSPAKTVKLDPQKRAVPSRVVLIPSLFSPIRQFSRPLLAAACHSAPNAVSPICSSAIHGESRDFLMRHVACAVPARVFLAVNLAQSHYLLVAVNCAVQTYSQGLLAFFHSP